MTTSAVTRLQLFIEAAELVGGENWVPNSTQWNVIKQKIMDLPDETAAPYAVPAPAPYHLSLIHI